MGNGFAGYSECIAEFGAAPGGREWCRYAEGEVFFAWGF